VRAVLVPVPLDGMTSGTHPLVAEGGGARYRFGKERRRAMGRKLAWAGVLPRGLFQFFLFLFFFFFSFSVLLWIFLFENFCNFLI
jgi:hypothetical protein